jgi:hypothetical protein
VKDQDEYLAFYDVLQRELAAFGFVQDFKYDFEPDNFFDANKMSEDTKAFSRLNIGFAFRKMPKSLPIEVLMLPENEVQEFFNLYGEMTPMYRTGVQGDGSCFFHSVLYSSSQQYQVADSAERRAIVTQLRTAFSNWVDEERYLRIYPTSLYRYIEAALTMRKNPTETQQRYIAQEQEYHEIVTSVSDFVAQLRRLEREKPAVYAVIQELIARKIRSVKKAIATVSEHTTEDHIALFMEYQDMNVYLIDSESRVPTFLYLPVASTNVTDDPPDVIAGVQVPSS